MIPLQGFAPDADPTSAGVITDAQNIVPSEYGVKGAPSPTTVGAAALAAECRGSAAVVITTGSRRIYAGTSTKLYQLDTGLLTWTDRSRAGDYTLGTDDRWSFAQFGDSTLAVTPSAVVQRSISGGSFADVSGSPTSKIIVAASGFAVAFNTSTAADEWYCCAYLDDTDWTLDVTTQCVKGRLVQGAGQILAAKRLGDDIVAYKAGSMYVGRYQGAPAVWAWNQISGDIGCVGMDAVVDTPQGHVFLGRDNVYLFDGSNPKPLATGSIRRWLNREMSGSYMHRAKLLWDRDNHLVWLYYVGAGDTACTRCVVYHMLTGRWGVADETAESVLNYVTTGITYDGGTPLVTTFDTGPSIPYDSLFWIAERDVPAIFTSTHTLSALVGTCETAHITTGDFGDDEGYTFCDEVRLRFAQNPTTSSMTGLVKDEAGEFATAQQTADVDDGVHDIRQCGRWHRFRADFTGDFHLTAVRPKLKPAGRR